ncbi:hypothetical protein D1872_298880 [compost metagenome]
MSEIRMTSAASLSWCDSKKPGRFGLVTSSSPSMQNLRLTGSSFSCFKIASAALMCMKTCPLSSVAPRAYSFPSRIDGSKGGVSHKCRGSTG